MRLGWVLLTADLSGSVNVIILKAPDRTVRPIYVILLRCVMIGMGGDQWQKGTGLVFGVWSRTGSVDRPRLWTIPNTLPLFDKYGKPRGYYDYVMTT